MWKRTAAQTLMPLTKLEREVITDSLLKVQSIQTSLGQIDDAKLPEIGEIHSCLKTANRSLRAALRNGSSESKPIKR